MAEIKCTQRTSMDALQHLKCSMKIKQHALHGNPNSHNEVTSFGSFISNRIDVT